MSRSLLQCSISRENHRLDRVKVFMQEISVLLTSKVAHTLLDAQLDAAHQLSGLKLFIRDLAILHPSVTELLALDEDVLGVVGGPVTVGPRDRRRCSGRPPLVFSLEPLALAPRLLAPGPLADKGGPRASCADP